MSELNTLPTFSLDELLSALKPYQKTSIESLISAHGEEDAAKKWLAANGPSSTQQFGGQPQGDPRPFWDRLMAEFRLFICGNIKYKKDRDKLLAQATPTAMFIVSGISSVIASTLGLAAALITPAIAILLHVVGKVGVNAWCETG
ncbi:MULTISPECIES: hypothetical protein [unclassified Aeromonas]|uniref:hypothetical protein n=1 Tax=unclassified Aeromonas TaxID=257493 RepID=UPI003527330C